MATLSDNYLPGQEVKIILKSWAGQPHHIGIGVHHPAAVLTADRPCRPQAQGGRAGGCEKEANSAGSAPEEATAQMRCSNVHYYQ